jgi:hypothetical protein
MGIKDEAGEADQKQKDEAADYDYRKDNKFSDKLKGMKREVSGQGSSLIDGWKCRRARERNLCRSWVSEHPPVPWQARSDFAKGKTLREQREYLPIFTVRDELLTVIRENQVSLHPLATSHAAASRKAHLWLVELSDRHHRRGDGQRQDYAGRCSTRQRGCKTSRDSWTGLPLADDAIPARGRVHGVGWGGVHAAAAGGGHDRRAPGVGGDGRAAGGRGEAARLEGP